MVNTFTRAANVSRETLRSAKPKAHSWVQNYTRAQNVCQALNRKKLEKNKNNFIPK
jgi:hypothetical protein